MSTEQVHPRTEIRRAVVSTLARATGTPAVYPTDCADRVFASRADPLLLKTLPALSIYTPDEPVDQRESCIWPDPANPGTQKRTLRLAIEIIAPGIQCDDLLDRIALQVETAMAADPSIGRRAESLALEETEIAFFPDGERLIAAARLTYAIVYRTKTVTAPAAPGIVATHIMGSWAPDIGRAHVDDYIEITAGGVPPLS